MKHQGSTDDGLSADKCFVKMEMGNIWNFFLGIFSRRKLQFRDDASSNERIDPNEATTDEAVDKKRKDTEEAPKTRG